MAIDEDLLLDLRDAYFNLNKKHQDHELLALARPVKGGNHFSFTREFYNRYQERGGEEETIAIQRYINALRQETRR